MIRVSAPSRLHFGLLSLPDAAAPPRRAFGGAGLMIREPGLRIRVGSAATWSCEGPLADRAEAFGRAFAAASPEIAPDRAFAIRIDQAPPEHVGLGSGTQLAMAVADGIAQCCGLALDAGETGKRVGRGRRSGIGVHGFRLGGFLVDGGRGLCDLPAPCVARLPFPQEWSVLLAIPEGIRGECGAAEREAFAKLASDSSNDSGESSLRRTEAMARLLLLGILPALAERDLPAFGEALFEYNRCAGEMFRPVQGGVYAHPLTAALVDVLREGGIRAAGQSSWGPTVYAIGETDRLTGAADGLARRFGAAVRVLVVEPLPFGAGKVS